MTPEQELAKKELDTFSSLSAVANTEGGRILRTNLAKDIIQAVEVLSAQAGVMQEQSMRALGMKIAISLQMYRALSNAEANMIGAREELDALLNS